MADSVFAPLEKRIDYRFVSLPLLERALTHRSYEHERPGSSRQRISSGGTESPRSIDNEQMEFLGDSILGFVVSEALFRAHPELAEGQLSQRKAHLVSALHLYDCALQLHLGDFLRLGRGEERNGGRERRNLLANALEAIIAAIYLDGGIEPARAFIHSYVLEGRHTAKIVDAADLMNYKSLLQEQAQARGLATPRYAIVHTTGPEHAKLFTVEVRVGADVVAHAIGSSKKAASQLAAKTLMEQLREGNWTPSSYPAASGL